MRGHTTQSYVCEVATCTTMMPSSWASTRANTCNAEAPGPKYQYWFSSSAALFSVQASTAVLAMFRCREFFI